MCECQQPESPLNGAVEISVNQGVSAVFTCNVGHVFGFPPIEEDVYVVYCLCAEWSDFTNVSCRPIGMYVGRI